MPTVLVYGDSNSHGTPPMAERGVWTRMPFAQRWTSVAARALGAEWEVIVEALPGRTTVQPDPVDGPHKNGMLALRAVLESHAPIDIVVLMLGTNDLKMRFNLPAVDIATSVGRLVEEVRASGCARDVLIVCPAPVRETGCLADVYQGAETRGAGLFVHMMQEAARRGCGFVDAGAHVAVDPLDGVHLDVRSHAVLGAVMADALRDRFARLEKGSLT
ncbi:SGNH/GDSL hydrolase family protein [Oceaniglobus roseus]|uniref:SGNH/GDSL hydrolase family protein n=1 Tax=Oceaniglobus roseus TaxID=1737570 RepID=UPI000C7EE5DC|nr:SGNH/GDSL hydrolase family protein [Kandeliimicrobium roseum]